MINYLKRKGNASVATSPIDGTFRRRRCEYADRAKHGCSRSRRLGCGSDPPDRNSATSRSAWLGLIKFVIDRLVCIYLIDLAIQLPSRQPPKSGSTKPTREVTHEEASTCLRHRG